MRDLGLTGPKRASEIQSFSTLSKIDRNNVAVH